MFVKIKTKDQYVNIRFEVCEFGANGNEWIADYHRLRAITHISISVKTLTGGICMGSYLNPGNKGFQESLNSEIYVDKTGLIEKTNAVLDTRQKFLCVSRPRRFGKSMAATMIVKRIHPNYLKRSKSAKQNLTKNIGINMMSSK